MFQRGTFKFLTNQGKYVLMYWDICFLHTGHFFNSPLTACLKVRTERFLAQSSQVTWWPHGINTQQISASIQILHNRASSRSCFSIFNFSYFFMSFSIFGTISLWTFSKVAAWFWHCSPWHCCSRNLQWDSIDWFPRMKHNKMNTYTKIEYSYSHTWEIGSTCLMKFGYIFGIRKFTIGFYYFEPLWQISSSINLLLLKSVKW